MTLLFFFVVYSGLTELTIQKKQTVYPSVCNLLHTCYISAKSAALLNFWKVVKYKVITVKELGKVLLMYVAYL